MMLVPSVVFYGSICTQRGLGGVHGKFNPPSKRCTCRRRKIEKQIVDFRITRIPRPKISEQAALTNITPLTSDWSSLTANVSIQIGRKHATDRNIPLILGY